MKNIGDILKEFSDYELAIFYKYRLPEYLQGTQTIIKDFIFNTRGLDNRQIDNLTKIDFKIDENEKNVYCPRCKSTKLLKTPVKWIIPLFRVGYEDEYASWKELKKGESTYKDKIECFVCGNVLYDPNNEKRPFYKRILDILLDKPY